MNIKDEDDQKGISTEPQQTTFSNRITNMKTLELAKPNTDYLGFTKKVRQSNTMLVENYLPTLSGRHAYKESPTVTEREIKPQL